MKGKNLFVLRHPPAMAGRLSDEHMDQLEDWINTGPKQFNLLYSITRDGCGPTLFHKMCDNRGPTVTVVYNIQGSAFGGYTSLAWGKSGEWKRDDQAFMFQLAFSYNKRCRMFPSKKANQSVLHGSWVGPVFGNSSVIDLLLFNANVMASENGVFSLSNANGQATPSQSYEYGEVTSADINNGCMDVIDIEVYSVTGTENRPYSVLH